MKMEFELDEKDKDLLVKALNYCKDSLKKIAICWQIPLYAYLRIYQNLAISDNIEVCSKIVWKLADQL